MQHSLVVTKLQKKYKKKLAVKEVSLKIKSGEIIGILGPNGSGKTTTFYMIAGLIKSNAGTILLNDEPIEKLPIHARSKKGIGYLPQDSSIFRNLTVTDNIKSILELRKNLTKQQQQDELEKLLQEFNIEHIKDSIGMSLSGGERKRVEVARLLAASPDFLLLDEPFSGVDPVTIESIQKLIVNLKEKGFGILITDHNVKETLRICDYAYVMVNGEIISQGNKDQIYADPIVKKCYLGNNFLL